MARIYMDCHATTPCDPRVVEAMAPYFTEKCGNAASRNHAYGREASEAVEAARRAIAALIGAREDEIVFTSGATESNNLALKGVFAASRARGNHLVTAVTEHPSVLDVCRALGRDGLASVTLLPVDPEGLVRPDDVRAAITDRTVLVSVMTVNNEIGVVQPVGEIGAICAERGVPFHTDATQAVGRIPVNVQAMNLHLASFTAHKMYGPKGVGALYVRRRNPRVKLVAQMDGGGHEGGLRSGTLPVPLVVGFGRAAEIAARELPEESRRILELRERLRAELFRALDRIHLNGHPERRVPGNLHVSIEHVESERLIEALEGIAVSAGSACSTTKLEPSHVLKALGVSENLAHRSIRFGLGRFTTREEVDEVARRVVEQVRRLRRESPLYPAGNRG